MTCVLRVGILHGVSRVTCVGYDGQGLCLQDFLPACCTTPVKPLFASNSSTMMLMRK